MPTVGLPAQQPQQPQAQPQAQAQAMPPPTEDARIAAQHTYSFVYLPAGGYKTPESRCAFVASGALVCNK